MRTPRRVRRVRRIRRVVGCFVVLVAVGVLGVVHAPPAAAAATLEVEAGYAGGHYVPGQIVPVRVTVTADRLVQGTVQVRLEAAGRIVFPIGVPIEVSGGTSKEIVVGLRTVPGLGQATVTATLGGTLAGEDEIRFTGNTEVVGLLPGVVNRLPEPLVLEAGLGTAEFAQLDDAELETAGALDPLGTVVAGPEGVGGLGENARRNLLVWLSRGGRLVVDATPGSRVDGLPDAWQPGAAVRMPAQRGEVRFSSGAVAGGRWSEVVEPTPLTLPEEGINQQFWSFEEDLPTAIGRDGGLRIPSVGWLLGFLLVYVALAGPLVFLVLWRTGRGNWTWLAVGGVAVAFAAFAFVVGNDLRTGSETSHGSVVHTGPGGAWADSYVGLFSRSGSDGRAEFPAGWSASGLTNPFTGGGFIEAAPAGVVVRGNAGAFGGGGGPALATEADVAVGGDATVGAIELDPGGYGMVTGRGNLDATDGLEVTAVAAADGSLTGTVRNRSNVTMRDVMVVVAERATGGQTLAPGEELSWSLPPFEAPRPRDELDPVETPWMSFDEFNGMTEADGLANPSLWEDFRRQLADMYPPGHVVAAAWTRDWTPPIDAGGSIEAGRSVFVAESAVQVQPGQAPAVAVRRELLRGPTVTPADQDRFSQQLLDDLQAGPMGTGMEAQMMRFVLPPGSETAPPPLEVMMPRSVVSVEVWDGSAWVPLERHDVFGFVLDDVAAAEAAVENPDFGPASTAMVPAEAVRNGTVLLRFHLISSFEFTGVNVMLGAAP